MHRGESLCSFFVSLFSRKFSCFFRPALPISRNLYYWPVVFLHVYCCLNSLHIVRKHIGLFIISFEVFDSSRDSSSIWRMAPTLRNRRTTKEPTRLINSKERVRKKSHDHRTDPVVIVHHSKVSKEEGKRRAEHLWKLDEETQKLLNAPFVREPPSKDFRFFPGMEVLSLSKGMYHRAEVHMYCGAALPPTIFPAGSTRKNVPVEKWVATVLLHFIGWKDQYTEEVAENELISVLPTELSFVQGMLMAHEWNTLEREKAGLEEKAYSKSTWFLTDEAYAELEIMWQELSGRRESFGEFCGRIAAATSGSNGMNEAVDNNNGMEVADDSNNNSMDEAEDNDSLAEISSVSSATTSGNDENNDS